MSGGSASRHAAAAAVAWKPRKAVVFDFDGTLADTLPGLLEATNRVLAQEGRRALTLQEARPMLGGGAPRLLEHAFRATGEALGDVTAAVACWRAHYDECATAGTVLFPAVLPMLDALRNRGAVLGICTGKPLRSTLQLLDALGCRSFFSAVLGKESTPTPKPHPGHLHAVLAELGVPPAHSVMVGDSAPDVEVARAARVMAVLVTHGYAGAPVGAMGADAVIRGFDELVGVLDGVWA